MLVNLNAVWLLSAQEESDKESSMKYGMAALSLPLCLQRQLV